MDQLVGVFTDIFNFFLLHSAISKENDYHPSPKNSQVVWMKWRNKELQMLVYTKERHNVLE